MRRDAFLALKPAHLRLIAAVAEHGQLSLAAGTLAMTQPAASRMLREIEALVGAPLFERHAKGMRATPVGAAMARRAGDMIRQMQDLALEVDRLRAGRAGVARVGAVTGASVRLVAPAARRLRAEAPTAELTIQVGPSEVLALDLMAGAYDFALCRPPAFIDLAQVEALPARPETLDLVVSRDHPLAAEAEAPLAALRDYEWVLQARGSPIREAVDGGLPRRRGGAAGAGDELQFPARHPRDAGAGARGRRAGARDGTTSRRRDRRGFRRPGDAGGHRGPALLPDHPARPSQLGPRRTLPRARDRGAEGGT